MMTKEQYTPEKLFELGKNNYEKLVSYCEILEVNGFWDQARQVMKKTSMQVLDLYVQSVLINFVIKCTDTVEGQQREFIRLVTKTNPLGIPENGNIEQKTIAESRQYYELPPVLLQLCGLYDKERKEIMTEYFLDSFLNILLCMAYMNDGKDHEINEFIQKYYDKISNFIVNRDRSIHSEYIVRKLTSGVIRCDVEWVRKKQTEIEEKEKKRKEAEKKRQAQRKKEAEKKRKEEIVKKTTEKVAEQILPPIITTFEEKNRLQDEKLGMLIKSSNDMLRKDIVRIYYKYLPYQRILQYDKEFICAVYQDYHAQGGNSFIDGIMKIIRTWLVVSTEEELHQ